MRIKVTLKGLLSLNRILDFAGLFLLPAIFLFIHLSVFSWNFNQYGFTDEVERANVGRDLFVEGEFRGFSLYADDPNIYGEYGSSFRLDGKSYGSPWFDHPILWCLVLGAFASFFPRESIFGVRLPSLIFSTFECILIYLIGRKLFGRRAGLLAASAYVLTPVVILQTHFSNLESGVRLFSLLSIFFLYKHLGGEGKGSLHVSAVCAGLSSLCKLSGLAAVGFLFAILMYERRLREAFKSLAVSLGLASVYPVYGLLLNWRLYIAIMATHASRYGGGFGIDKVINQSFLYGGVGLEGSPWLEPFLIFSWLSLGLLSLRGKADHGCGPHFGVILSSFVITLIIIGCGNPFYKGGHTWYFSVLYPFLALMYGYGVNKLFEESNPTLSLIYLFLMINPYMLSSLSKMGFAASHLRWIILGFASALLIRFFSNSELVKRIHTAFLLALIACVFSGSYLQFWNIIANYPL